MLFLISLVIAVLTAFLLDKPLKKHPGVFYVSAAVLTAASIIIMQSGTEISSRFVREYVIGIFSRGALGGAFWAVVMWAGALPNGSAPIKKLMPIRGELSITAAIITLSHIITYGLQYISNLIKGRTGSDFWVTSIVCIIMVLIMIPLTVMSFKAIRKKMNAKMWKKIQRFAYIFYALIYVHIMVLFVPKAQSGREGYFLSVLVYSAVFIGYAAMRIRKAYVIKKKPEQKALINILCSVPALVVLVCTGAISYGNAGVKEKAPVYSASEGTAVFTFKADETTGTTAVTSVSGTSSQTTVSSSATETTSAVSTVSGASSSVSVSSGKKTEDDEGSDKTMETTAAEEENDTEEKNDEPEEQKSEEEQSHEPQTEKQEQAQPEQPTEPQVKYKYKNGEYEADAEGYAGKVHVKITLENDVITSFSAWADDDDPDYFSDAMNTVIPQIASKVSADGIDACSGATYSSNGIIEAAEKALEQAMN